MSSCQQYEPYLIALIDDQPEAMPPEIRQSLHTHVLACPACQAEIVRQRQMANLLAAYVPPAIPAERWRQVWATVDEQTTSRVRSGRVAFAGWSRWAAVASGVAIAAMILLAVLLWPAAAPTGSPGGQPVQTYAFATQEDSDIQEVETYADDETPVVITSGGQDVVVVWMVQKLQKSDT